MADNQPEESKRRQGVPGSNALIRAGGKLVKKGAKKLATTAIAETAPEWIVPAAILSLCAIVFFVIFGVITPGGVAGGDLSNNPSPSPAGSSSPGPTAPPGGPVNVSNVVARLKSDFNIVVSNASVGQQIDIYNIFALPFTYINYKNLITGGNALNIILLSDSNGCHGYTPSGTTLNIYNYSYCQTLPFKNRQYLLIHESGHVITQKNIRIQQAFDANAWNADPSCYESSYLKTYPLRCGSGCGISPDHESFAEAIADYIMCSGGGTCQYAGAGNAYSKPIYNFPSSCPNTNNWVGGNIY